MSCRLCKKDLVIFSLIQNWKLKILMWIECLLVSNNIYIFAKKIWVLLEWVHFLNVACDSWNRENDNSLRKAMFILGLEALRYKLFLFYFTVILIPSYSYDVILKNLVSLSVKKLCIKADMIQVEFEQYKFSQPHCINYID